MNNVYQAVQSIISNATYFLEKDYFYNYELYLAYVPSVGSLKLYPCFSQKNFVLAFTPKKIIYIVNKVVL